MKTNDENKDKDQLSNLVCMMSNEEDNRLNDTTNYVSKLLLTVDLQAVAFLTVELCRFYKHVVCHPETSQALSAASLPSLALHQPDNLLVSLML